MNVSSWLTASAEHETFDLIHPNFRFGSEALTRNDGSGRSGYSSGSMSGLGCTAVKRDFQTGVAFGR
jgi:hypothetical protein